MHQCKKHKESILDDIVNLARISMADHPVRLGRGILLDVMAKVLDCSLEVSVFEPQSHCYVHFQTNTLGKVMNPIISSAIR